MMKRALAWFGVLVAVDGLAYPILKAMGSSDVSSTDTISVLLVFDTLIVLWWYTSLTHDLASTAQAQARASNAQLGLLQAEREEARRPCVVIDWCAGSTEHVEAPEGGRYKVRNVGRGLAVNVLHVDSRVPSIPTVTAIGALGPGDTQTIPVAIHKRLSRDTSGREVHHVVAEALGSNLWVITRNIRQGDAGRISHSIVTRQLPETLVEKIHREGLDCYIDAHWADIEREAFGDVVNQTGREATT